MIISDGQQRDSAIHAWLPGEGWRERTVREFGMDMYTLLYLKCITNKDLLCSTGSVLNVMWQPGWEESLGESGYMYMYS